MTYADLLKHFGTPAAIATALSTDRQRIHGWKERDKVPIEAQIEIEVATAGALRADIPDELRAA